MLNRRSAGLSRSTGLAKRAFSTRRKPLRRARVASPSSKSTRRSAPTVTRFAQSTPSSVLVAPAEIVTIAKPRRETDEAYLNYIRSLPCLICRQLGSDPDHLKTVGSRGSDYGAVPLCRTHHTERHAHGTAWINARHNIDHWFEAHRRAVAYLIARIAHLSEELEKSRAAAANISRAD